MTKLEVRRNQQGVAEEQRFSPRSEKETSAPAEQFESARWGTLVPGIIHNLSTPLSGVIGGIQLLETRSLSIAEGIEKLGESASSQWQEILGQLKRSQKNIELISRNAQGLSELLKNLAARMSHFSLKTADIYSLNHLVEMELRFLEFDLTFKHRVRRSVHLAGDLPPLRCIFSTFAQAFDEIVYTAMERHGPRQDPLLEMVFSTAAQAGYVAVSIDCSLQSPYFAEDVPASGLSTSSRPTLQRYFDRLREEGWEVETRASDLGTLFELKHFPVRVASRE